MVRNNLLASLLFATRSLCNSADEYEASCTYQQSCKWLASWCRFRRSSVALFLSFWDSPSVSFRILLTLLLLQTCSLLQTLSTLHHTMHGMPCTFCIPCIHRTRCYSRQRVAIECTRAKECIPLSHFPPHYLSCHFCSCCAVLLLLLSLFFLRKHERIVRLNSRALLTFSSLNNNPKEAHY